MTPEKVPESARRRCRVNTGGPWGSALLLLGVVIATYGVALILSNPGDLRGALAWINRAVHIDGFGLLWVGAGVWSVARALTPPQRHTDIAPAVGVLCVWSALYGVYWLGLGLLHGVWTRDWIGAVIFGAFAAVIIQFSRCVNPPRPHP